MENSRRMEDYRKAAAQVLFFRFLHFTLSESLEKMQPKISALCEVFREQWEAVLHDLLYLLWTKNEQNQPTKPEL